MKDFIPRYNYWCSSMVRYPSYYRYGLTVLVICGLCIFWYLGIYRYVNTRINFYTKVNEAARMQLIARDKKQSAIAALPQAAKLFQQEMRSYKEAQLMPNEFFAFLIQQLFASHIVLVNSSIEAPVHQSFYIQYPIKLDLHCSFESLLSFLQWVSLKSKLAGLSLVTLSKHDSHTYHIALRFDYLIIR